MKKVMLFTAAAVMILALAAVGCGKIEESKFHDVDRDRK